MLNTLYYVHNSTLFNSKIVFEATVEANKEIGGFIHLNSHPMDPIVVGRVNFTLWKVNEARPNDVYARPKHMLYIDPANPKPVLDGLIKELEVDAAVDRARTREIATLVSKRRQVLIEANIRKSFNTREEKREYDSLLQQDSMILQLGFMMDDIRAEREERAQLIKLLNGPFNLTAAANQEVPQL